MNTTRSGWMEASERGLCIVMLWVKQSKEGMTAEWINENGYCIEEVCLIRSLVSSRRRPADGVPVLCAKSHMEGRQRESECGREGKRQHKRMAYLILLIFSWFVHTETHHQPQQQQPQNRNAK
ncbi:hypothetical protein DMENIID0001_170360 [Sergentomyia squamirostris]